MMAGLSPPQRVSGSKVGYYQTPYFGARKPAENLGFFGPLWHMEDIDP